MFNNAGELEQVSNLTIGTLMGDSVVAVGSTMRRTKRSAVESTDSQYTIPVDESIEKMYVTITTAKEVMQFLFISCEHQKMDIQNNYERQLCGIRSQ